MKQFPKVYLVRAGRDGEDEDHALENNRTIVGFKEVPSLEKARDYNAVAKLVGGAFQGKKPRTIANFARQLCAFALDMQEGDLVVLPRKLTSQIAIGRVTGPYRYGQVNTELRHVRPVQWVRPRRSARHVRARPALLVRAHS